jgi:hypothetical protein
MRLQRAPILRKRPKILDFKVLRPNSSYQTGRVQIPHEDASVPQWPSEMDRHIGVRIPLSTKRRSVPVPCWRFGR